MVSPSLIRTITNGIALIHYISTYLINNISAQSLFDFFFSSQNHFNFDNSGNGGHKIGFHVFLDTIHKTWYLQTHIYKPPFDDILAFRQ